MSYYVSIDPGSQGCGVAIWGDDVLVHASYMPGGPDVVVETITRRLEEMKAKDAVSRAFCEFPQTYGGRAQRGDANDLIQLAYNIGKLEMLLGVPVIYFLPPEWKRQVPKEICRDRAFRKLTAHEVTRIRVPGDKKHALDMWDGIGIGLVALKRALPGLI